MSLDKMKESIERKEYVKRLKAKQSMKKLPIHNFDEVGFINGKINKQCGMCEGSYLANMYYDLMTNPINNYVTCVDDYLYDQKIDWEEFKKKKVSIILKLSHSKNYDRRYNSSEAERATKAELICSRVANLYNIRTEYVAPIKNNPYGCIIVDFLRGEEQLEDYKEFAGVSPTVYDNGASIRNWTEPLCKEILCRAPGKDVKAKFEYVRPMIKDLVKQYIFKKYIVHDADFCSTNLGIVSTPNNKIMKIAPIYDFEKCLLPGIRSPQGEGLEEDLQFLVKQWPGLLKTIINDFTLSKIKKQSMKKIIASFEPSEEKAEEYYNIIENSTFNFITLSKMEFEKQAIDYDKLLDDNEMERN